jgi:hypothetical protein
MGGTAKKNSDILQGMEGRLVKADNKLMKRIKDLVKV